MKYTLLEIVQAVLNVTDGDEVNSIADTTESLQTAYDIRYVYYDLIGRKDWQFLRKLKPLESVSDASKPTHLKLPSNASKIDFLMYNKRKDLSGRNYFKEVYYKYPDEFLLEVNQRDNTKAEYQTVVDFDGAYITIRNDKHPEYFTSFDDKYVVMDGFNGTLESTLMGDNTQAGLFLIPTFSIDDDFTADLPMEMFPMFVAECITFAQAKKDDIVIQKTQGSASSHQRHLSQTHGVVQSGVREVDFGRRPAKGPSTKRKNIFGPKS